MQIADSLAQIRQNIARAQAKSPHGAQDVRLLAVSKTQPIERVAEAAAAGQMVFAENRVQELLPKIEAMPQLEWHLIGHLQTNKAKYIVDKIAMLHSLDRVDLAQELNKRAQAAGRILPVLVQVNIAEEESKFGIRVGEVADFLDAMADFPAICVRGLMTIGPFVEDAEGIRPVFRQLRLIRDCEQAKNRPHIDLRHLSMGMSGDYQVAVEEGADMVRVGSLIFGARMYGAV